MRYRTAITTLVAAFLASLAFTPVAAQYESNYERLARLTAPADVYYFFDGDRKHVASYNADRIMRVCLGDGQQVVPLRVIYDDNTATVGKNDCIRVEAKELALEPAEPLEANVTLRAEVETMN